MDSRRLSTADLLITGILGQPIPATDIPKDREECDPRGSASAGSELDAGKLLYVPEYYGIVAGWKDEHGYHGRLLQYRNVTECPDFATAEDLLAWFHATVGEMEG